jgi:DNA-directed RNA polymerase specialized sigma24 family protein
MGEIQHLQVTTVQLQEETDDEPIQLGDDIATQQEVEAELSRCQQDQSIQRRLMMGANMILNTTAVLKVRCQPEDLLQHALLAILSGRRRWKRNRVDFHGLVFGAMKSLAYSHDQSLQTKDGHIVLEHELGRRNDKDLIEGVAERQEHADDSLEKSLIEAEQEESDISVLRKLRVRFAPEDLAGRILDKMMERQGLMPMDIRTALGVGDREFWSAYRRITRALTALSQSGVKP